MTKTKLTFFFFFIFLYCSSQISGTVYDIQNIPIESASVFLIKSNDTLGKTISNKKGFFEFKNVLGIEDAELVISHISYETLITKSVKEKTYFLFPREYLIEDISITSKKKEKKNTVKRALGFIFNDVRNMAWEDKLATFISSTPENNGKKIKSLKYQLSDLRFRGVKNNKYQPFRACIYTVDTITNKPKEKIYRSEKVRMTKNQKWFHVAIDTLDIKMPKEGLFIVMEALTGEEYNRLKVNGMSAIPAIRTKVYNPNNPNKSYHYHHWKSRNKDYTWEFYGYSHFCMEFEFEE